MRRFTTAIGNRAETILSDRAGATGVADDVQTVIIAAMLITLSVVALAELRYMRKKRRSRSETQELPDRAHNAILTTKAIRDTMARGGVRSDEANDLIREAEAAQRERNYRVAVETADRAKVILRNAKQRQAQKGDIAKLERIETKPGAATEETTEEKLTKELPPNYMPAKFTINLAHEDIAAAQGRGADTATAAGFAAEAQREFDAQDFDAALRSAIRARRSLEPSGAATPPTPAGSPAQAPPPVPARGRACASCGAGLAADDTFCRKCGAKVELPPACPSCGTPIEGDDAFCRKCGTRVRG